MPNVFAVPVFFIVFRETVETGIVISILLSYIKQQLGPSQDAQLYKKLRKQVRTWIPTLVCINSSSRSGQAPSSASPSALSSAAA